MKFGPFLPTGKKFSNFFWDGWGLIWKAGFSFDPNFPWLFSVTKWNSCQTFWFKQFTFHIKETNKIWNLDTFRLLETNLSNLFWADLESRIQFWPKLCIVLPCRKVKLVWRSFCSGNLLFRQKKEIKSDICILFALSEQIEKFWGCLFGKQHSVLA